MELKINEVILPEQITFNYEELKQELTEKVSHYETLVYTDDQIQEAKKDKSNLNKLKKALNDERIRREKEYMQPFNDFKSKVNEIIGIIDTPIAVIDRQVKEYEEKKKQEKKNAIFDMWCNTEVIDGRLTFDKIFNEKWLNASVSMKSIQTEMVESIKKFNDDMATLANLPEFGFEATELYISTLDLNKALNEGRRLAEIAKKKAEFEAEMKARAEEQTRWREEVAKAKAEAAAVQEEQIPGQIEFTDAKSFKECMNPPVEPVKQWISFSAYLTVGEAQQLRSFFEERNIEFKAV